MTMVWLSWTLGHCRQILEASPSNADPEELKKYQRRVKKTMFIIGLNLVENQFVHIKNCKGHAKA